MCSRFGLPGHVLPFAEGEAYERELEDLRAKQRAVRDSNPKGQRERKAKAGQTLRERDPW